MACKLNKTIFISVFKGSTAEQSSCWGHMIVHHRRSHNDSVGKLLWHSSYRLPAQLSEKRRSCTYVTYSQVLPREDLLTLVGCLFYLLFCHLSHHWPHDIVQLLHLFLQGGTKKANMRNLRWLAATNENQTKPWGFPRCSTNPRGMVCKSELGQDMH